MKNISIVIGVASCIISIIGVLNLILSLWVGCFRKFLFGIDTPMDSLAYFVCAIICAFVVLCINVVVIRVTLMEMRTGNNPLLRLLAWYLFFSDYLWIALFAWLFSQGIAHEIGIL